MFATLHTTAGDIRIELLPNHAPKTVANFVGLAKGTTTWTDPATGAERNDPPLYDGVIFHRVIDNFMIQGGDRWAPAPAAPPATPSTTRSTRSSSSTTSTSSRWRTPASAATPSRAVEGTNGSQFFITTAATPWLNGKHSIFGKVADDESRAVVDAIGNTPTRPGDRPVQDIVINSVTIDD